MSRLETRQLEYFVAVAEELHFGRAAARLSIAQPALSKAVRRLELELGVPLLSRSTRHVALTEAGAALLHHGRHALDAVSAAERGARQAANAHARMRLVIKPSGDANLLSGILAAYATQPGARQVDVLFDGNFDRVEYLHDGRADIAVLYTPLDTLTGLAHETLLVEEQVAVLPQYHRLATRRQLRSAEIAAETFVRWTGTARGAVDGPQAADLAQVNQLVAIGQGITVLPRSLVTPQASDVACVPILDLSPSRTVLAWPEHRHSAVIDGFVKAAITSVQGLGRPRPRVDSGLTAPAGL